VRRTKPAPLRKGDLIALISPASRVTDGSKIDRAVSYLEGLGYRVLLGESALKLNGYLAGTDQERAADLHVMFENPLVKAIFCIRGGYGTPRLLPLLRYGLIARNPKIFVGYSDITALHLAFWKKAGLVTFHGPMAGVEMAEVMDPFTEELFWRLLTSPRRIGPLALPDPGPEPLVSGKASGFLLGGNLALLASLVGTPYLPRTDGALLFLEEIGEEPYRVDRMLTQLRGASLLPRAAGILLGRFTDCVVKDPTSPSLSVSEVLEEYLRSAGRPSLAQLPFGHDRRNMTLPLGIRATMDTRSRTLSYLEGAVH
jgi:muramoyltetrapeptide carboxypeptidase